MKNVFRKTAVILMLTLVCFCIFASGCSIGKFSPNVTYKQFGAAGDGKTDDFFALKAAHEFANENGVAVKADKNATYFVGAHEATITVKTNVDWGNAKFIIDDKSAVEGDQVWWYPLFDIRPDTESYTLDVPEGFSVKAGQKNIGLKFSSDVLLLVENSQKKDFIRYGLNADSGYTRQEVVLVHKNGDVDKSTPFQWDFDQVTKITVYSVDEKALTLQGGVFTTIANDDSRVLHYFNRGLDVKRSNTKVVNVQHFVTDEGAMGSPYNGFFRANYANNVTFQNCILSGHKTYQNENGVNQGTYDTRLGCCNNVRYVNCKQANDISDVGLWGVMCSDYCKNLYMENCSFSRFDAHKGVYNATIKNSVLGQNISVCGGGKLLLENVVRLCPGESTGCNRFVTFRDDYGSFWYGDVELKNCELVTAKNLNYILSVSWVDHDFGYVCRFPQNIRLENVKITYVQGVIDYRPVYVYSFITENPNYTFQYAMASPNAPILTEKVVFVNTEQWQATANKLGWQPIAEIVSK